MNTKLLAFLLIAFTVKLVAQPKVNSVSLIGDRKLGLSLAQAVAKDNLNNTVIVGRFQDTCDFDNGPGVTELVSVRGAIFIAKYSPMGNLIFAKMLDQITNPQNQYSIDIFDLKIDNSNNIYIGGFTNSPSIDFDPSSSSALLGNTSSLGFIAKYDLNGNYLWVNRIIGSNTQSVKGCRQIAIDNTSNRVRVTGEVWNTSSSVNCTLQAFNGPNYSTTFNVTSFVAGFSKGVFICTFDNSGNFITGTPGQNKVISACTDPVLSQTNGTNVCFGYTSLIGSNYIPTLEFINASGVQGAVPNLSPNSSSGFLAMKNILFDASNNYYITCNYRGDSYALPSSTVTLPYNAGEYNMAILKMNISHQGVWAKHIGNTSTSNSLATAFLDPIKGLFAVGTFSGTIDFNFGAGSNNITTSNTGFTNNSFIINVDANGNYISAGAIGGFNTAYASPLDIEKYDSDNFIMCGAFTGKLDFDYYANDTLYTINPVPNNTSNFIGFVSKYANCASPPSSPLVITGNTLACSTNTLTYSIAPIANATSYNWLLPSGWIGTSVTNSISITPSASGQLSVTANNNCGASLPAVLNVSVNATPSVVITITDNPICSGASTALKAIGATTFTWSNSATTSSIIVSPTITTSYTVTGANGNCTGTESITVNVNPLPTVLVFAASNTICAGQSNTLTCGGGANTYTWSSGLQNLPLIITPIVTTTYSVTGTDGNGCEKTTIKTITVNATPTITANSGSICLGNSFTMSPSGASTYTYSNASNVATPTTNSTYTITGTAVNSCTATTVSSVTVNPLPTVLAFAASNTICAGQNNTLTCGGGANTYTWSSGLQNLPLTITPSVTTTYSVNGTDANGCENTAQVTVTVNPLPSLGINSSNGNPICAGQTTTLTASGAQTFFWPDILSGNPIRSVSPSITTTYNLSGIDNNGCSAALNYTVFVNPLPNATIVTSNTLICVGQSGVLSATSGYNYLWLFNGAATNSVNITPTVTTTYSVLVTDANNCQTTASYNQVVSLCTGISSNSILSTISLYPNPFTNIINISNPSNEILDIKISNSLGQIVIDINTIKENVINTSHLSSGIYLLQINNQKSETRAYKLIKN